MTFQEQPIYNPARIVNKRSSRLPDGKRLPRGWSAVQLAAGEELVLQWTEKTSIADDAGEEEDGRQYRLRFAVALDCRDTVQVEALLAHSRRLVGIFDIRYTYTFQPFELALLPCMAADVVREGVVLRYKSGSLPLWIFDELDGDPARRLFSPHLLAAGCGSESREQRVEECLRSALSLSSMQPFGWLEGCVLDGLKALLPIVGKQRVLPVMEAHLRQYVDEDGRLDYEDLQGRPAVDTLTTIEATLPLAAVAQFWQDHPLVRRTLTFWEERLAAGDGVVADGKTITAEGMYTVAYPMAVIAVQLDRRDLAEQAVAQALHRRDVLGGERHIDLRYYPATGERTFRNWSRAYAWYMLGMTRTWAVLAHSQFADVPGVAELERELARTAQIALHWQLPDGLWSVFLDEPDTGVETSGSAGIAAALALGARYGLLERSYLETAQLSLYALSGYLTPDGLLTGVSQHNAGGVELQRGGYRVISQMGMGLLLQLYAAVQGAPFDPR